MVPADCTRAITLRIVRVPAIIPRRSKPQHVVTPELANPRSAAHPVIPAVAPVLPEPMPDERLRMALELASMAAWDWDLRSGTVTLSSEAATLFGATSGSMDALKRLMHPEDVAATRAAVGRALRGEHPYAVEFRIVSPKLGRSPRRVAVRGHVQRDPAGAPLRVSGICADVTAQREAEARLTRDALILENVRDSVIVTDLAGVVTFWNRGAEDLLGWSADEIVGRPLLHRFPAEARPGVAEMLQRIIAGEEFAGEFEDHRKDGSRVWIETRVRLLFEHGKPTGVIGVSRDISARKRAEDELRLSEIRYRSLVERAPLSIQTFAPGGAAITANAAWARLWDSRIEDLRGYNILEDRQLQRKGLMPLIRRAFAGEVVTIPPVCYDPSEDHSGRPRWVEAYIYPLEEESGALREVVVMLHDVTDKIEAVAQLKRSQRRYESLVMASAQVVWTTSPEGDIVEDLPTWRQFTGQSFEEMAGRGWTARVHPDDLARVSEVWQRSLEAGTPHEIELRIMAADGSYRIVSSRAVPVRDPGAADTAIREWVGTLTDITDRRRAEETLFAREREFKAVVENARDIIARFDRAGRHLYINPVIGDITGLAPDAFVGRTSRELGFDTELCDAWEQAIAEVFATGQERSIEFSFTTGGGTRHFHARIVPEYSRSGDVETVMGITRDLTERRLAEQRLAHKAAELARSNSDLEGFAYIASHDLKEPLRGIANYAHFLLEDYQDRLDDEGKHKLRTLKTLASRMDSLLDALLEYSRVGRTELAVDNVDMEEIIADVIQSLRPRLEEMRVEITVHPLPVVRCDRVRVRELVSNLITNAFKYNDRQAKSIEVGSLAGAAHDQPTFFVRDNGIGIPPQHQTKLFRMFRRLHGRDRYGGGTGSGLAIAKRIAERHGGRIWLESTPGEGTTFFFTLAPGTDR